MQPSIFGSILRMTCPRCRRGDLFPTSSFSFNQPFKQYEHCPQCGQSYFPEPGFYYGAMFISYIGSGFFCLAVVAVLRWVLDFSFLVSFLILAVIVAVLFVWWFRFSRSLYAHLIIKYRPEATAAVDGGQRTPNPPRVISGT